jgi:hypothetical protein
LRNAYACAQALLEGISLSQPQPKIPPELIKFLGKAFNAWHIAIPLLESHVIIFPDETRCFDALAELYKLVRNSCKGCCRWHDLTYGWQRTACLFCPGFLPGCVGLVDELAELCNLVCACVLF